MGRSSHFDYRGITVFKVRGNSMWPFIKDGDVVVVKPTDIGNISLGHIVLAQENGVFFCHRLFRKRGNSFQTKADALFGLDPILRERNLIGKVIAIKRGRRIVITDRRVHTAVGFIILWATFFISPFYCILRGLRKIHNYVFK